MDSRLIKNYENETGVSLADNLTGLFNHGFFQISLENEIKRSERYGDSFTLAMIGVDAFSRYNKRFGPAKGDRILKDIASLITDNIRAIDCASRFSGDIIAIIMQKSDTSSALIPLERIRKAIESLTGETPTVSIGFASFPEDASSKEKLVKIAHDAMIKAKISGKNRAQFFNKEGFSKFENKTVILAVDDEPQNLKLITAMLIPLKFEVIKSSSGEEALEIMKKIEPDMILLDVMMPGIDGYEVCRRLKSDKKTRMIPIVMVTALDDIDAKVKSIEAGADDFITKPANKAELQARVKSLVKVKKLNDNLASIEDVLISLANTVEAKDSYTQGHTERVASLAVSLGKKMLLTGNEITALKLGGILHDIGKIGISREILNKPGPLDDAEWKIMKRHPDIGYDICLPLKKTLGGALDMIQSHHEKLDGSGYPDGKKGDEISKTARIMAVVDIYDALVTDRPYRKGMSQKKAVEILEKEADEGRLDRDVVVKLSGMFE